MSEKRKTIQMTRSAAISHVKRNYGLTECDDNQFEDQVNRTIGESREEIEGSARVPSGYELAHGW